MWYQLLWIFFIYALLGWCTEVSYAALITGTFVNRGFLNGPVCPVYGFGVVIWKEDLEELSFKLSVRRAELADEHEEWVQRQEERRAQARLQLEEWHASMQELLDKKSFGHRRLLKAFPRLRSIDHGRALERLHRRVGNLRKR